MNDFEYLVTCLMEECVEVAQRCSKILRFGLNEREPGQELDNEERLVGEICDLRAITKRLNNEGYLIQLLDSGFVNEKARIKLMKLDAMMKHSRDRGCLHG